MRKEDGSRPGYFQTLALVEQLIARLEGFVAGRETNESLQRWAHELRQADGTQQGPLALNSLAALCLLNLYNAAQRLDSGDFIFRVEDAAEDLQLLRAGWSGVRLEPTLYVNLLPSPTELAEALRVKVTRHVVSGLGWMEGFRFASRASGRHFALECALEVPERVSVVYCERRDDAAECLIDVLETLCLDRDDVSHLCDEFAAVELPRWTLWRQDDNGQRANMASFTGRRKAERRQAELEALGHKQTYWVELG